MYVKKSVGTKTVCKTNNAYFAELLCGVDENTEFKCGNVKHSTLRSCLINVILSYHFAKVY